MMTDQDLGERILADRGYLEEGWRQALQLDPGFVAAVFEVGSRSHHHSGQPDQPCLLSVIEREQIATVLLLFQGRTYFAFNHVVRLDRMGVDRQVFLDALIAAHSAAGFRTIVNGIRSFMMADGLLPDERDPLHGQARGVFDGPEPESLPSTWRDSEEWRYAEARHAAWLEALPRLLSSPGEPRLPAYLDELIPATIFAWQNDVRSASALIGRALARGATPRHVMEAAEAATPMTGFPTVLLIMRALRLAESGS